MKIAIIVFLFIPSLAFARVFDFNKESVAAYLRGTTALSQVGDKAFGDSSGASTETSGAVQYNFGGEFGAMFMLSTGVSLRLGLELYQAKPLPSVAGKSSAGVPWFDLKSTVFSWGPIGTVEVVALRAPSYRLFFYGGGGYGSVTMENSYTMTAAGTTALGGVGDYIEKSEATAIYALAGTGIELHLADATTVAFDLGYRYFPISKFTYKADVSTIQGAKTKGGTVVNDDGSTRAIDLGGITMSFSLRFYIDLI